MRLTAEDFDTFFEQLYQANPFPWQQRLARQALAGQWPTPVAAPTASGKTATLDIAVFALAAGAPGAARRIFFVVDRRIVVDEASRRASALADRLQRALKARRSDGVVRRVAEALLEQSGESDGAPLRVAVLRGGLPPDLDWPGSPLQPVICCTTVDQIGSALLFRGYGARSSYNWPVAAAMAAYDALYLIDEAHLSRAWIETLATIRERYRDWAEQPLPGSLTMVELTATPGGAAALKVEEADRLHPVLGRRLRAAKPARLVEIQRSEEPEQNRQRLIERLSTDAEGYAGQGHARVAVVVNRVRTAREVYERLARTKLRKAILLTGRARPWDRDRLLNRYRPILEGPQADGELFVVATQAIEVGANFDFDALVSEVAALDALRQRFGRLNRFGHSQSSPASIVGFSGRSEPDPVYGKALGATWGWLKGIASRGRGKREQIVDFGTEAMEDLLPGAAELAGLCTPRNPAPVLLPAHMDHLAQTEPEPAPQFDVSLLLHGERSSPDVALVWRGDLPEVEQLWAATVGICPPAAAEAVTLPFYEVRQWLGGQAAADVADVERNLAGQMADARDGRKALWWRGVEDSQLVSAADIRPGMTLVVPSRYGGCDEFGWNPESRDAVEDIGDFVTLSARGRAVLRLAPALVQGWAEKPGERLPDTVRTALDEVQATVEIEAARELLRALVEQTAIRPEVRLVARVLLREPTLKLVLDPAREERGESAVAAVIGSRRWRRAPGKSEEGDFFQEDARSSMTVEVELEPHLEGVARRARTYARHLGLTPILQQTLFWAGRLHDVGKADPRFQAWLRGGRPWDPETEPLLAKSAVNARDVMAALRRARELAGYPEGGRHELLSTVLAEQLVEGLAQELDRDLLLHLIAGHHGRCRPFAPVVADPQPVEVAYGFDGREARASSRHELERADRGVSRRFWRLIRRYGWYGLAYLEALLRLADQQQSRWEQAQSS